MRESGCGCSPRAASARTHPTAFDTNTRTHAHTHRHPPLSQLTNTTTHTRSRTHTGVSDEPTVAAPPADQHLPQPPAHAIVGPDLEATADGLGPTGAGGAGGAHSDLGPAAAAAAGGGPSGPAGQLISIDDFPRSGLITHSHPAAEAPFPAVATTVLARREGARGGNSSPTLLSVGVPSSSSTLSQPHDGPPDPTSPVGLGRRESGLSPALSPPVLARAKSPEGDVWTELEKMLDEPGSPRRQITPRRFGAERRGGRGES